jgi:DNA-binding beta-propeller fold protein YncE
MITRTPLHRPAIRPESRAIAAVLVALTSSVLAEPAVAAGDGSLTRLGGEGGCLSVEGQRDCARARALGEPRGVAVSPGGGNVYVTSARADGVAVFRRSRRSGRLHQLRGRAACVRHNGGRRCRRARALRGPSAIVVSRDGRNVYVGSFGSQAIAVFARSRRTGALRQLRGRAGCVRERPGSACRDGRALSGPSSLELRSGGRFLYAGSGRGIAVFRRNPSTGALAQLGGADGCVTGDALEGCALGRALSMVSDVALERDGENLYAASPDDNAVAVFDLVGGAPRQLPGSAGCISHLGEAGCTSGQTLNGVFRLAASPGGAQLYATAEFSGAVAILARDQVTGALSQPPGPFGCIRDGGALGCAEARFMGHPDDLQLSHDGRNAYVRAEASDLVVLRRNQVTGELSQLPGKRGCIASGNPGCADSRGLAVTAMALSRDGRNAYIVSDGEGSSDDAVAVYRRRR